MEQIVLIVAVVLAAWFAVAAIVALGMGRAVKLADGRRRDQLAYSAAMRSAAMRRTPVRVR